MDVLRQRRVRPAGQEGAPGRAARARDGGAGRRCSSATSARGAADPALRRPAPAGRPGPGPGQPAQGAAARRAARRPRPQAAPRDAARAQADPARRRHHLRVRDARPGGGADDERPDRGLQRRPHRAGGHAGRALREPRLTVRGRLRRHVEPARRARPPARSLGRAGHLQHPPGEDPPRRRGRRLAMPRAPGVVAGRRLPRARSTTTSSSSTPGRPSPCCARTCAAPRDEAMALRGQRVTVGWAAEHVIELGQPDQQGQHQQLEKEKS